MIRAIRLFFVLFILTQLGLACSAKDQARQTPPVPPTRSLPSPAPTLTPTPPLLPPFLVESKPQAGGELGLRDPVTFYFDQPMQRQSVEKALSWKSSRGGVVQGKLEWQDDATLQFLPVSPLEPASELTFSITAAARSIKGMNFPQPVEVRYRTAGFLHLTQALPEPGASGVNPTAAVVAAFNQPLVPLGSEGKDLPAAFRVLDGDQLVPGRGEWLNTSTFIFYPEPFLAGGRTYSVYMNRELRSASGSPLQISGPVGLPVDWSFSTAPPSIVAVSPASGSAGVRLDAPVVLTFNQPMEPASAQASFRLAVPGGEPVPGKGTWNADRTALTFQPENFLERSTSYEIRLDEQALAGGGTPLSEPLLAGFETVPTVRVSWSSPERGGKMSLYSNLVIYFSAPVQARGIEQFLRFEPEVANLSTWWDESSLALHIYAGFQPSMAYTLELDAGLSDPWGGSLGENYILPFRTAPLQPELSVSNYSGALFLTPLDRTIQLQVTNLDWVEASLTSLTLDEFLQLKDPDRSGTYQTGSIQTWTQTFDLTPDASQEVDFFVTPDRKPLPAGLYWLCLNQAQAEIHTCLFLAVSPYALTVKLSATDVLVWAIDLQTGQSLRGAPISIYKHTGELLAAGQTGADGVFTGSIPAQDKLYREYFAVLGKPGEEIFSISSPDWNTGLNSWDFDISSTFNGPRLKAYVYSDRPIYRPGDTVHVRAVVRQAYNGRYQSVDLASLPVVIRDGIGEEIYKADLPLNPYGTSHLELLLETSAQPGYYSLSSPAVDDLYFYFQVAEYRKPEIDLQAHFTAEQVPIEVGLTAEIQAHYFFDAPASNADVQWSLYASPEDFWLPGYQVGLVDTAWLDPYQDRFDLGYLGILLISSSDQTGEDGSLLLSLTAEQMLSAWQNVIGDPERLQGHLARRMRYSLEVTVQDESGLPVSTRTETWVNPVDTYFGIKPDNWASQAGQPARFEIQAVNPERQPVSVATLYAELQKVTWELSTAETNDPYGYPIYIPEYTTVDSFSLSTDAQGQAQFVFTPPEPGTYQVNVYRFNAEPVAARSEIIIWVAGPGQSTWPAIPNNRLRLVADKEQYQPGDKARLFVPNPFGASTTALVTLERGTILSHRVTTIHPGGGDIEIPLTAEEAPNVYLSVTLLAPGGEYNLDFRYGLLNLNVEPSEQLLQVSVGVQPEKAGPGEEALLDIQVSDSAGDPVQGEFSLAVIDKAVLALAEPNAPAITDAFYARQPLGVQTGLAQAIYAQRKVVLPYGLGGGGGGGDSTTSVARQNFPDTAYWGPGLVTDAAGHAQVSLRLPDTLTTWVITVRGLDGQNQVGEASVEIVASKELLIRPVTPRFLVAGDHLELGAVVQNNTSSDLEISAALQSSGLEFDDAGKAVQTARLPARGRLRFDWWVTVANTESVDLVFSVQGTDSGGNTYSDVTLPPQGALPVRRYTDSQVFQTAGILEQGGQVTELVSVPRSFTVESGNGLQVELSPSLASSLQKALDVLEQYPYECTEQTVSRFLPNLETYRVMSDFGITDPELRTRLERTLRTGIQRLQNRQNTDGGWGWWEGSPSDSYLSAYALLGLVRARAAGIVLDDQIIQAAASYLQQSQPPNLDVLQGWQLDRLTFEQFVLGQLNLSNAAISGHLFDRRDLLSPWAQGLLALILEQLAPGNSSTRDLVSNLETSALRSTSGAHWEIREPSSSERNFLGTLGNSAVVVYVLAQRDPGTPLLADAVRYLMANRDADGSWHSTYTSAWAVMALDQVIKGTGELGGTFTFTAAVNGTPIASGQAGELAAQTPTQASVPLSTLSLDAPNILVIERAAGNGRLYYRAALDIDRPAADVPPLAQGMSLQRAYDAGEGTQVGQRVKVHLTLTLPQDIYYLALEDTIPAGAEIVDASLKTSQVGPDVEPSTVQIYDPRRPYEDGWGWWLFNPASIYDDHITWTANFLPAGTYELTYSLLLLQPGEYQIIPARAWQFYFPEVQATSAGETFEIVK